MLNLSLMEGAVLQSYGTMRKLPDNLIIVGYHEDRCPPEIDPFQELHDRFTRFRIQISCRFICNEQSRIIGEGPGDHHALPLSRSEEHTSELQSRGHLVCRL